MAKEISHDNGWVGGVSVWGLPSCPCTLVYVYYQHSGIPTRAFLPLTRIPAHTQIGLIVTVVMGGFVTTKPADVEVVLLVL